MSCRGQKSVCQPGGCSQPALSCAAPEVEYISSCSWDVLVALVKNKLLATFLFTSSYAFWPPLCVSFRIWAVVDQFHLTTCEMDLWLGRVTEPLVEPQGRRGSGRQGWQSSTAPCSSTWLWEPWKHQFSERLETCRLPHAADQSFLFQNHCNKHHCVTDRNATYHQGQITVKAMLNRRM